MDPVLHRFERVSWAPFVQIGILCIGTLITFVVAYGMGDVSLYLPFISETGAKVPAMCIFTFTLIFGSVAGAVSVCYRTLIMKHMLFNDDPRLLKVNNVSTFVGLLSMAGLAGVAAFPVSTVFWAHLLAAGVHFICALGYMILQTFLNHRFSESSAMLNKLRILLCAGVLFLLFLLVIFFPLAFSKWHKVNSGPPALKTPEDDVFGLMFTSAFCEWVMYAVFLSFMASFAIEFRKFHIIVGVVPAPPKTEEDA